MPCLARQDNNPPLPGLAWFLVAGFAAGVRDTGKRQDLTLALLGNGPEIWLKMQQTLDLWNLEREQRYNHIQPVKIAA